MTTIIKGEALFAEGKLDEAEECFWSLSRMDPNNTEALNNLGVIAFQKGELSKSVEHFTRCLGIDPFYKDAILNYSEALRKLNVLHEFIPILEEYIRKYPEDKEIAALYQTNRRLAPGVVKDRLDRTENCAVSDTIWDYKRFKHQKYPSRIDLQFFKTSGRRFPLLNKKTKITSIGSCFARNIAEYLFSKQYNYLVTESPFKQASAHWDQVFNTACMRQIFEYTFDDRWSPLVRWWHRNTKVQDPFRRDVLYPVETCDLDFLNHRKASHQALTEAKVIILTLGLIETWRDKRDRMTFYRVPPPHLYDPDLHEFYVQNIQDCVSDLDKVQSILQQNNPNAHIIVTVSPVPLFASIRTDVDAVTANAASKSTLRTAAEYFALRHSNVHYFPSYEIVTQAVDNPYQDDNRHVTQDAICSVMDVFESLFVTDTEI